MSKSADGSERRTAQRRRTHRRATDENSVEILESMSDGFAAVDRERKRMEAALDEQQRFIRRITDLSPVMLDVFNVVTESHHYFSSDVVHLLGHTADQIARMEDKFSTLFTRKTYPA